MVMSFIVYSVWVTVWDKWFINALHEKKVIESARITCDHLLLLILILHDGILTVKIVVQKMFSVSAF